MRDLPNPYTPGAGDPPPRLVGRERQLALAEAVRERVAKGLPTTPLFFVGLRGVGKTVLLHQIAEHFWRGAGWFAPYIEARKDVPVARMIEECAREIETMLPRRGRLSEVLARIGRRGVGMGALGVSVNVGPDSADAASTAADDLREVLRTLAEAARADGKGVILLIDEFQSLSRGAMQELIAVVQQLRISLPVALIGAGLPHLPSVLTKAVSYADRFQYEPTGNLDDADVRAAVRVPAQAQGVDWDEDALARLAEVAQGYPYAVQLCAFETWEAWKESMTGADGELAGLPLEAKAQLAALGWSSPRPEDVEAVVQGNGSVVSQITRRHLEAALPRIVARMRKGLFASRYGRLTPKELDYVHAMLAELEPEGTASVSAIAEHLGQSLSSLSPVRERLITKGVVFAPRHGRLAFAVPWFATFLLEELREQDATVSEKLRAQLRERGVRLEVPGLREGLAQVRGPRIGF